METSFGDVWIRDRVTIKWKTCGTISNVERDGGYGGPKWNVMWCERNDMRYLILQNTWNAIGLNEKLQATVTIRKETWYVEKEAERRCASHNSILRI